MDWSTGVVNFAEDAHAVANNLQMAGGVGALVTTGAQLVAKRACTEFIKLTAKAVAGIAASNAIGALTDRAVKLAQLLGVTVDPYYLRAACERLQVVSLWKAARSLRKAAGAQCFVAGTEVLTGSASRPGVFSEIRIEDVRAGDLVWAKDQYNSDAPLELKRVVQTFARKTTDLQTVRVRDETGHVETLHVTDEHPFYVDGLGWTGAAELRVGQRLVSPDGLTLTVVGNVDERHVGGVMVYNFEVEGAHTYFVADGNGVDRYVWAHNRCGPNGEFLAIQGGRPVEFPGVRAKTVKFIVRSKEENDALRKVFDNELKPAYLKKLGADPDSVQKLRAAGITDEGIDAIRNGESPPGYRLHHIHPLKAGGTNDESNFILTKQKPYHEALTAYQNHLLGGKDAGYSLDVDWSDLKGIIYPG